MPPSPEPPGDVASRMNDLHDKTLLSHDGSTIQTMDSVQGRAESEEANKFLLQDGSLKIRC